MPIRVSRAAGIRRLLGSAVREGWPEVADFNDNVMKVGLAGGTLSYRDQELTLFRSGAPEQVWMNLDYSPVIGESGEPIGVIAIVVETSEAVRVTRRLRENEARLQFLDALGKETAQEHRCRHDPGDHHTHGRRASRRFDLRLCRHGCRTRTASPSAATGRRRGRGTSSGITVSPISAGSRSSELGAGLPLVINDNLKELAPEEAATFQSIGIGATICMPLVKEGRLTALMAIHHKDPHVWTDDELALITRGDGTVLGAYRARARRRRRCATASSASAPSSRRKVAERTAALQQSEKNIRTVFETSYLNQGLLTTEGKIVYVNATALASIKSRLEDVVGRDFWETPWFTGTPGMPEKVREGVARVAAGESIQIAMPLNLPTGRPHLRILDAAGAGRRPARSCACAGSRRDHRARPRRAGAAAGAEDGGHRQAHRRRRARLQQPADGHPRQSRTAAQAAAGRSRRCCGCSTMRREGAQRGALADRSACWPSRAGRT